MTEAQRDGETAGDGTAGGNGRDGARGNPAPIEISVPATSANLGPGFDALGLAMSLRLMVRARLADVFSITASGRDAAITGALEQNLIRSTYEDILRENGRGPRPLEMRVANEIPLGMGCGSSAAALCAGVMLANHFGELGWGPQEVLQEAARREGHPDNVAACLLGGLTASKMGAGPGMQDATGQTLALSLGHALRWRLLLALPQAALSTEKARGLLPDVYRRADAVANVQATALLVAAFALNRPDLLRAATGDWLHQPYRMEVCALLPALLPLAGKDGVYSVTLSGAGPAVLLVVSEDARAEAVQRMGGSLVAEVLELRIGGGAEVREWVIP